MPATLSKGQMRQIQAQKHRVSALWAKLPRQRHALPPQALIGHQWLGLIAAYLPLALQRHEQALAVGWPVKGAAHNLHLGAAHGAARQDVEHLASPIQQMALNGQISRKRKGRQRRTQAMLNLAPLAAQLHPHTVDQGDHPVNAGKGGKRPIAVNLSNAHTPIKIIQAGARGLPKHFAGQATAVFPRRCRQVLQVKSVPCHGDKRIVKWPPLWRMNALPPLGLVAHFAQSFERAQKNEGMATSAGRQKNHELFRNARV